MRRREAPQPGRRTDAFHARRELPFAASNEQEHTRPATAEVLERKVIH